MLVDPGQEACKPVMDPRPSALLQMSLQVQVHLHSHQHKLKLFEHGPANHLPTGPMNPGVSGQVDEDYFNVFGRGCLPIINYSSRVRVDVPIAASHTRADFATCLTAPPAARGHSPRTRTQPAACTS